NQDKKIETITSVGKKILVLGHNGDNLSPLPNWPQEMDKKISDMAIGNMDDKNNPEIVVNKYNQTSKDYQLFFDYDLARFDILGEKIGEEIKYQLTNSPVANLVLGDFKNKQKDFVSMQTGWCLGFSCYKLPRQYCYNNLGNKIFERVLGYDAYYSGETRDFLMLKDIDSNNKLESIVSAATGALIFEEEGINAGWPMEKHDYCNSNNYNYKCD
ncbi:MAG: hypothetical protein CEN92_30, partial [Candidatus Berkelbacteria bacterium Licking1014_96]